MWLWYIRLNIVTNQSGASPKSGDNAFGARTALDFNGNFHYGAIFEKIVESQKKNFQRDFFQNQLFRFRIRFKTFWIDSEKKSKILVENFHYVAILDKKR